MNFRTWLKDNHVTLAQAATRLRVRGRGPATTVKRWADGAVRADADTVERIVRMTEGAVTAQDMHKTRLDWLRANKPERFDDGDDGHGGGSGRKAGAFDPPVAAPVYDEPFAASPHGNFVTKFFRGVW